MAMQYDPVSGTYYDDGLDALGGAGGVDTTPMPDSSDDWSNITWDDSWLTDPAFNEWLNFTNGGMEPLPGYDANGNWIGGSTSGGLDFSGIADQQTLGTDPSMWSSIINSLGGATSTLGSAVGSIGNLANSLTSTSGGQTALASLLGAYMASQGSQQTGTQTTTQAPWEAQQPYLKDLFAKAQAQAGQGQSAQETDALNKMMEASSTQSPLMTQAQWNVAQNMSLDPTQNPLWGQNVSYQNTLPGIQGLGKTQMGFNPFLANNNPYLEQSINSASQDAMRGMMPMFLQRDRASGSFGNTGLAESQARTAAETLGNISNNARMGDYQTRQAMMENRLGQDAGFNENFLNRQSGAMTSDAANQYNAQLANQQRQMNLYQTDSARQDAATQFAPQFQNQNYQNLLNYYNAARQSSLAPWENLKNYGATVGGQYGSISSSPLYENKYASMLGGAATGAGLLGAYNQNNAQTNLLNQYAAAAGG